MAKNEANSLSNEINSYEFILSIVIWYDILEKVNIVRIYSPRIWKLVLLQKWYTAF